jgi:hypothetical protein
MQCGNYSTANARIDELISVADDKGTAFWKASGMVYRGSILALTGQAPQAIHWVSSAIAALQSTGTTLWLLNYLSHLALVYAELGQLEAAWRCLGEADAGMRSTN